MDNLNQVGGNLSSNRKKSNKAITRTKKIIPQIERVRDVLDFSIPMEFQFVQKFEGHRVMFTLTFYPPPKNGCCADCYCAVCEFYAGGTTETQLQTTYSYIPGSITAFKNNMVTTNYTETNPPAGEVTLWAHTNEDVVLCYQYDACIGGPLDTTQQKFGFSYPTTAPPPSPYPPPTDDGGSGGVSPPPPVPPPPPPDTTYVPPPPSSGTRRFALPTVTATFSPGGGVASDGVTDCTSAMQSFVNSVPDGSTIYFPAGARYRMAGAGIQLSNRNNLIFTTDPSNPATILTENGNHIIYSQFTLDTNNHHISIQYIIGRGNNPDVRTFNQFHSGNESAEYLAVYGDNSYIELDSVKAYDEWGHFVYISQTPYGTAPSNVWIHNSTAIGMGVMGIAIASVVNMWVEDNSIVDTAIYPIDFEDGQANQPMHNVTIARNILDRWGWNSYYTGHCMDAGGSTGMSWNTIVIDSNTIMGGFQSSPQNGQGAQISFGGNDTKYGLVITNNHGITGAGPIVSVNNAPNAIISGNTP